MKFRSTRGKAKPVSFKEALFQGLATDGGLYLPETNPKLSAIFERFSPETQFTEIAGAVTEALLSPEINGEEARRICSRAFPFSPAISEGKNGIGILELYHGPSCAFKDFGASFLASSMEFFLEREGGRSIILTATSGDTGSAVAYAFRGKRNIDVVILYPKGRVSPLQEKQLTTVGGNVTTLEVEGSFDDCQRMVKQAFLDPALSTKLPLTSANSISLGRLIPQSFYYIWARSRYPGDDPFRFCVPSGNFGNLTAGVLASLWGMRVDRFIAATNANDVVPEYLTGGSFTPRPSISTRSNAMDVGDPSNFERLAALLPNRERMRKLIHPEVVSDEETLDTIREYRSELGVFIDPHTAVGLTAAARFLRGTGKRGKILSLSTAHPGKFLETVREATGETPPLPGPLEAVLALRKRSIEIPNSPEALREFLLKSFA
jgi:threonine synthase